MRVRRRLAGSACLGFLGLAALGSLLAACGGNGQLSVTIQYAPSTSTGPFTAGSTAQFTLTVANNGPGEADGVLVAVDMPSSFRYKSTDQLGDPSGGNGGVRTEPLNARVGSTSPTWGYWNLGAPASGSAASVSMRFTADISGAPGSYNVTPRTESDNSAGTIEGKPLQVQVSPSAALTASATASQGTAGPSSTVTYTMTVSNTGSAPAEGLSVLIALPPVVSYTRTVQPFGGNASEQNVSLPPPGSVELFYSGFTLPAATSAGPGYLTLTFVTRVIAQPVGGSYSLNAQVSDSTGDVAYLSGAAPLTITGAPYTPQPTLQPQPSS